MSDDGRGGWESSSAGSLSYTPQGWATEESGGNWDSKHPKTDNCKSWGEMESKFADVTQSGPKKRVLGDHPGMAQPFDYWKSAH